MATTYTLDSAQAALQLGPVEYVCNACGQVHASTDHDAQLPCALHRCYLAWGTLYRAHGLSSIRDAADRLNSVIDRTFDLCMGEPAASLVWSCMNNLSRVLAILKPDYHAERLLSFAFFSCPHVQACLLMTPADCANAQIARAFSPVFRELLSSSGAALYDTRRLARLCAGELGATLTSACGALQAAQPKLSALVHTL